MIDITVIRGDGDIQGEDIVDAYLTSDAVAIQRGRNAIDADAKCQTLQLVAKYRAGIRAGQTVRVLDTMQGPAWYGKITSVDLAVDGVKMVANMSVERF